MSRHRILWSVLGCLALVSWWPAAAAGASPIDSLLTLRRVEADPEKDYRLGEENGPWMIMACSFSGDGAEQQARELVQELRSRYKIPAYMHRMRFDFDDVQGRGLGQYGGPIRMRYRRGDDVEEVAVLVGDYAGVDDPRAQKVLNKLKYSRPRCLQVDKNQQTNQTLAGWRMAQKELQELIGSNKKEKGPMGHAFITTNPVLPKEFFNMPGVDPLVVKMNEQVEHSLLDCTGKYTVQVATFKGKTVIDQGEIQAIQQGKALDSQLAEAADQAHKLTEALRMKGWEAYEFHDRYASIVTVGSFQTVGTPRADGRTEIHPGIYNVMRTFGAEPVNVPGQAPGATTLKSLVGIPFDVQPRPVHVPRRSISREMARAGN
ncbi:MAG: hypothetical protein JXB62_00600 [Pirellulales bacterium]|nr:hypothetical protein [Pirellulales bacterium]